MRDETGAEIWIVAVKGSFVIRPDGKQTLDPEPAKIARVPQFIGQPGVSSLLYESDLVHTKARTDVILHGHAYSPGGKPATQTDVRLKVATIDKALRVHGDRRWEPGLLRTALTRPEPFTRIPIMYERAFGGTDQSSKNPKRHAWEPRNPVGTGFATHRSHLRGQLAPNIEDPRKPYRSWRRGRPAGFGPIARHWSPRVQLAGTYDQAWEESRSPLLPADFDRRFYQCAPEDQQAQGFLKGGEIVELHNLTPDGFLSFRLPRVTLGMTTRFYDGTMSRHRATLHSVIIHPDERRFQLVWHSQLPCHQKVNQLEVTEVILKRRLQVPRAEMDEGVWIGA